MDRNELLKKPYWSKGETAGYCEVTVRTIDNWMFKKRLPYYRTPGGHIRFKREDVLKAFDKHLDGDAATDDPGMG